MIVGENRAIAVDDKSGAEPVLPSRPAPAKKSLPELAQRIVIIKRRRAALGGLANLSRRDVNNRWAYSLRQSGKVRKTLRNDGCPGSADRHDPPGGRVALDGTADTGPRQQTKDATEN